MEWSTCSSNNESGLLKAKGPHRLFTTDSSLVGVQRPQIIEATKPVTIGEVKIYGSNRAKEVQAEKKLGRD